MKKFWIILLALLLVSAAAMADWQDMPYWIGVDRTAQRTTVYSTADNSVVYQWRCSTGSATPHGTYLIPKGRAGDRSDKIFISGGDGTYFIWRTPIIGSILFHTYLFDSKDINDIIVSTVDGLGTDISHGCVRLPVDAARWIAQNCFEGTKVVIHDGRNDPLLTDVLGGATELPDDHSFADNPTAVVLNKTHVVVGKGASVTLTAELQPAGAQNKITWVSANRSVATVSQTGVVKGLKSGITTVYAVTESALVARCTVEVNDPNVVRRIDLTPADEITINKGETLQIGTVLVPETAPKTLRWSSSSALIASVSSTGLVTAKKAGTVTITCKAVGGVSAKLTVHVHDPYTPTAITLPASEITMNVGETKPLSASVTPETAVTKLTWTSSKPVNVGVDANGLLSAKKAGYSYITVKTTNGKKATVRVTVLDPVPATGVTLDQTGTIRMAMGETLALQATLQPEGARTWLTWTSASSKTASVDQNGVVTALKTGTAKITVTTSTGKKAFVTVTVFDPRVPQSVTLDKDGTVIMQTGETLRLSATVQPATAVTSLKWLSGYTKVATVDQTGLVTAIKPGRATISVSTANGRSASVKVQIVDRINASSMTIDQLKKDEQGNDLPLTLEQEASMRLTCTVSPVGAKPVLTWQSDNTNAVRVNASGEITAVGEGTAVITVKTDNGLTASITVIVPAKPQDPVEPQEPEEEQEPVEPQEPEEPAEPVESQEPEEPAESVEPQESEEPAEPVEPKESEEPAESVEPRESEEPAETVEPQEPAAPTDLT